MLVWRKVTTLVGQSFTFQHCLKHCRSWDVEANYGIVCIDEASTIIIVPWYQGKLWHSSELIGHVVCCGTVVDSASVDKILSASMI